MAEDIDISPLAAEMILQALHPVVHELNDVEASEASLADIADVDQQRASVAETAFRERTRTATERFGEEDVDDWAPHAVVEREHD